MNQYWFQIALASFMTIAFIAFWIWQSPGLGSKLSSEDIDRYLSQMNKQLPMEQSEKSEFLARMRAWGAADDGQPVFMLNVMRYYDKIKQVPGFESIQGTPVEVNSIYENTALPKLIKLGAYPVFGGNTMGISGTRQLHSNVMGFEKTTDDWSRILLVRYPSRRAFFKLLSDPEYARIMPYKLAALDVLLVPATAKVTIPDLRWLVGVAFMILFIAITWFRS